MHFLTSGYMYSMVEPRWVRSVACRALASCGGLHLWEQHRWGVTHQHPIGLGAEARPEEYGRHHAVHICHHNEC